jgi:aspartate-semialdehyde dehydrogenase
MTTPMPPQAAGLAVKNAMLVDEVSKGLDVVFCAVDMPKDETRALEESYARAEVPVVSANSANRLAPDVPMIIPEINPEHLRAIEAQKKRLGTKYGFIVVKPNCSIQSYVPALHPLREFGMEKVFVCTYQAISGAGKTFRDWPEMEDNVMPFIRGEEEKSEIEPMKIWGDVQGGKIVNAKDFIITSQCIRVPVTDGHLAAVFVSFKRKPSIEQIRDLWERFEGRPQKLGLPSAPKPFIHYFEDDDRPQTRLDRDAGNGMGISIGRLREDRILDYRFVCLSHNTVRGAAGGGILSAELLREEGYIGSRAC